MTLASIDFARLGPPSGSRIVVAGGCGGMGRVLVQALLDTGVEVVVLDLPTSIGAHPPPPQAQVIACDASDTDSVSVAFAVVSQRWTAIDGFVNLVGFMKAWQHLDALSPETFDEVISGNLRSHFLAARAALPLLRASGNGSLVSVASTMAMDVYPGYTHYGAAKAAVVALVKGMARENAPCVRVNAVAPGLTNTAFLTGGTGRPKVFDEFDPEIYAKRVPMKRVAVPDDMAGPILFLLGPASRFINGETISVDGGIYLRS